MMSKGQMMRFSVVLVLFILLWNKGFGQLCPLCDCCKDNKCNADGVTCPDGCIDGYWDDNQHKDCRKPCLPGCLRCTNGTVCDACKDGYYGPTCEECTSAYCKTCSGTTCLTCIDGRYGHQCNNLCLSDCKTCDDAASCLTCVDGKHGNQCEHECQGKCKTCDGNEQNDCTSCPDGKWHTNCNSFCGARCKNGICNFTDGKCECSERFTGDTCLDCIAGRYGADCSLYCPELCHTCDINADCVSCKPGYTSSTSDCTTCPNRDCLNDVCLTNGTCDICTEGRYGDLCDQHCPSNCYQQTCNRYSGKCNSCLDGYFGGTCDGKCPANCTACSSGIYCTSCVAGSYGTTCEHQCPGNCICDSNNEQCISCKNGYNNTNKLCQCVPKSHACTDTMYEDDSDPICCPCSSSCKNSKCSSETSCTNGCVDRLFGLGCSKNCSGEDKYCEKCILNENNNHICTECANGFYPNDNGTCINCSNGCLKGQCNSSTGHCTDGCKETFWSNRCDHNCPENCVKQNDSPLCYVNGTCALGCQSSATYSPHCNITCDERCQHQECVFETGKCLNGCIDGFVQTGNLCDKVVEKPQSGGISTALIGGAAGGGGGLLIIILVVVVCVVLRRRKQQKETTHEDFNKNTESNGDVEMSNSHKRGERYEDVSLGKMGALSKSKDGQRKVGMAALSTSKDGKRKVGMAALSASKDGKRKVGMAALSTSKDGQRKVVGTDEDKEVVENSLYAPFEETDKPNKSVDEVTDAEYASVIKEKNVPIKKTKDLVTPDLAKHNKGTVEKSKDKGPYENTVTKDKMPVDKLAEFVAGKDKSYFEEEFKKFPQGLVKPYVESQREKNKKKNRYVGMYPYDDSRVTVKEMDTDYINASYVHGYKQKNKYIAALGPTIPTMKDFTVFWKMVWQQNVEKIVMVTKLAEDGKPKCDKYWPDNGTSECYTDVTVECHSEDVYSDFVQRSFSISKGSKVRTLHHLNFTAWPDKGTPEDVTALVEFRQKVLNTEAKLGGPIIVHCSAGVGRTGTYIALDILTREGEEEGAIDIPGCIRGMRQNRTNMVQTTGQYWFLHNAIVHTLTFGSKPVPSNQFASFASKDNRQHRQEQFQNLESTSAVPTREKTEAMKRNREQTDKNREGADIPGDLHRVRRYQGMELGTSDYINAVYINSYRQKNRYILAQTPLPTTVEDFLTLLLQERTTCVVMMDFGTENDDTLGAYYPTDEKVLKTGQFTVSELGVDTMKMYYKQRKLKLTKQGTTYSNDSSSEARTVTVMQFTDWNKEKNVPNTPSRFLQFIQDVDNIYRSSGKDGPILIHCLNGGGNSGLFCVVSILLEKMSIEHEVSVVNTVRQVRTRRPVAIPNEEQFEFCHKCVNEYLQSFQTYSNFA